MNFKIVTADYSNAQHSHDIFSLLNDYALDPMGGGQALTDFAKKNLIKELLNINGAITILAYSHNKAVGLINCFNGFSTFECKPLLNIHDVVVLEEYRGHGLCQTMLNTVMAIAMERGCCKLTLEVLEGNDAAKSAYSKFGFQAYELDPKTGKALFWQKKLG